MALVLMDGLVDSLMFTAVAREFSHDSFIAHVMPPKYAQSYRAKVIRYFDEKREFCEKELKFLTAADSKILKIAHSYRNAAYHRDIHNPQVIAPIARILFHAVLRFFLRGIGMTGGFVDLYSQGLTTTETKSAREFCEVGHFIDYKEASKEAVKRLKSGVPVRLPAVRSIFVDDLRTRLTRLARMEKESLFCKTRAQLDDLLKLAAFELKGLPENLSAEIRCLRYRIGKPGPGREPSREEYQRAEERYLQEWEKAFGSFIPDITAASIDDVGRAISSLQEASSHQIALSQYAEADSLLLEIEVLARYSERKIEEAIQAEIDIRRGK